MSNDEGWIPADEHERAREHDQVNDDEYEDITDDERHHTHQPRQLEDDGREDGSLKTEQRGRNSNWGGVLAAPEREREREEVVA